MTFRKRPGVAFWASVARLPLFARVTLSPLMTGPDIVPVEILSALVLNHESNHGPAELGQQPCRPSRESGDIDSFSSAMREQSHRTFM